MEPEEQIQINKKKIQIFFEKKLRVHITKTSGYFLNGAVTKLCENYFYIQDESRGKQLILYDEIKFLQLYQVREKKEVKEDGE